MEAAARLRPDLFPPPPAIPPGYEMVWNAFAEIRTSIAPTAMGTVAPITFRDIQIWQELTAEHLGPMDVRLIRAIDDVAIKRSADSG